jgi:hypothetical protein
MVRHLGEFLVRQRGMAIGRTNPCHNWRQPGLMWTSCGWLGRSANLVRGPCTTKGPKAGASGCDISEGLIVADSPEPWKSIAVTKSPARYGAELREYGMPFRAKAKLAAVACVTGTKGLRGLPRLYHKGGTRISAGGFLREPPFTICPPTSSRELSP